MVYTYDDEGDNQRTNLTKKIKAFLWIMAPNDQCDAKANNHELGQQALSLWESEKKEHAIACRVEVRSG